MKTKEIGVLISKKIWNDNTSWGITYGVLAELENEDYTKAIEKLDNDLRKLISIRLPGGKNVIVEKLTSPEEARKGILETLPWWKKMFGVRI